MGMRCLQVRASPPYTSDMHLLSLLISTVHAADTVPAPTIAPLGAPSTTGSAFTIIWNVFSNVKNILLLLAGLLAVIYLIWAGLQYISSAGNPEKTKVGRAGIVAAVAGIIIIVATYAIIKFAVGIGGCVAGSVEQNGKCVVTATKTTGSGSGSSGSGTGGSNGSGTGGGEVECPLNFILVDGVCIPLIDNGPGIGDGNPAT